MTTLSVADLNSFVNQNIKSFHDSKLRSLSELKLNDLLKKKNPYLFRAKNHNVAAELITDLLAAHTYSSEEKLFGDFLEELAIYVSAQVYNGRKSSATGIDLEFDREDTRYLVSIKSGANWGNSSQHKRLAQDFDKATLVQKQSKLKPVIQPVLGICYGKVQTTYWRGSAVQKIVGQSFWLLISGSETLYTDIVEPIGFNAHHHNRQFDEQRAAVVNRFTDEFSGRFCEGGVINWVKLVEFNSGNLKKDAST